MRFHIETFKGSKMKSLKRLNHGKKHIQTEENL